MHKLFALCFALLFILNACASGGGTDNPSRPAGSEIAQPGPVEAGRTTH